MISKYLRTPLFQEEDDTPAASGIGSGGVPAPETAPAEPAPETTPSARQTQYDFTSEDAFKQFVDTLPDELKGRDVFKNTKNFASLAKQTVDAQSALGKRRLVAPSAEASDAELNEFYANVRPESYDKYQAKEAVTVTFEGKDSKDYTFDPETTDTLKNVAFELGLHPKAFNVLQQKWAEHMVQSEAVITEQINSSVKQHVDTLREQWGTEYGPNHRAANEAFAVLSEQVPELVELVEWSPFVANHPGVMKLFHLLSPLVADMGMPSGGQSTGFGKDTIASINAELQSIAEEHGHLLNMSMDQLAVLTPGERAKRERILARRTELYQKKFPSKK